MNLLSNHLTLTEWCDAICDDGLLYFILLNLVTLTYHNIRISSHIAISNDIAEILSLESFCHFHEISNRKLYLFYSLLFYYTPLHTVLFYSVLFCSVLLHSVTYCSVLFYSVLFYYTPLYAVLHYVIPFL